MVSQRRAGSRLAFRRRDFVDRPGVDAHAVWADGGWPSIAGVFASLPQEVFYSHATSVDLDGAIVQFATGSARALDRTADQARADGNAMLVAGVTFEGEIVGKARGRAFRAPPGHVLLLDLAQPCTLAIPASRSVQLAVPRALAERHLGAVRRLHGRVVPPGPATLFVENLRQLETVIPTLALSQGPRLTGVLLDLLAIATRSDDVAPGDPRHDAGARRGSAWIRAAVAAAIAEPSLNVAALCQRLGVSRSTLARAFGPDGGVQAHVRNLRLDQVRAALLDPADMTSVRELADRWGFTDASHLTRAFRSRFGVTPGAMRSGRGVPP